MLASGQPLNASELLGEYTFQKTELKRKAVSYSTAIRVFVRDGFIDRHRGGRLIFPPVLRIIAEKLGPEHFPFHPNWKTECTHPAFWELGATVDHLAPVTGGGSGDLSNLVSTSMTWNAVKSNCTLEELGWGEPKPCGDIAEWDGLLAWFLRYVPADPNLLNISMIYGWYKAVFSAAKEDDKVANFLERTGTSHSRISRSVASAQAQAPPIGIRTPSTLNSQPLPPHSAP